MIFSLVYLFIQQSTVLKAEEKQTSPISFHPRRLCSTVMLFNRTMSQTLIGMIAQFRMNGDLFRFAMRIFCPAHMIDTNGSETILGKFNLIEITMKNMGRVTMVLLTRK